MTGLEVMELRKTFPARGGTPRRRAEDVDGLLAVDDVSFNVPHGGSLGLVGESGSGKTTIARMLAGLERPDAGTISVDGRARRRERGKAARLRRARDVQLVFQDPYSSLDPRLTPAECLDGVLRLGGMADRAHRRTRLTQLLEQVRLRPREAASRPRELSGGQRQRVAIARALAVDPTVLVLDEPVAALDVSIQAQILQLLAEIRAEAGTTYVFVSHDLAVVRQVTEQTMVLYQGRLVEQGRTEQVLRAPEHPYSQLLLASVPGPGWDPSAVSRLRQEVGTVTPEGPRS